MIDLIQKLNKKINFRYVPPVFITLILVTGHLTFGILEGYLPIILSISASILTEMILARLIGKWKSGQRYIAVSASEFGPVGLHGLVLTSVLSTSICSAVQEPI
jgi:hypothetical protein